VAGAARSDNPLKNIPNPLKTCATVTGPKWSEPGTTKTGTRYAVTTLNFSCETADKLVPGLAGQKIKRTSGSREVVPKPPAGDTCPANPDNNDHAYSGHCQTATAVTFSWEPAGG
jgi:hypothetical protein